MANKLFYLTCLPDFLTTADFLHHYSFHSQLYFNSHYRCCCHISLYSLFIAHCRFTITRRLRRLTLPTLMAWRSWNSPSQWTLPPHDLSDLWPHCSSALMSVCDIFSKQIEKTFPSGMKEIIFPDGAIKYLHPDGKEETTFPDGTVVRVVNGVKILEMPNGQKEIHTNNYKVQRYWEICTILNPEHTSTFTRHPSILCLYLTPLDIFTFPLHSCCWLAKVFGWGQSTLLSSDLRWLPIITLWSALCYFPCKHHSSVYPICESNMESRFSVICSGGNTRMVQWKRFTTTADRRPNMPMVGSGSKTPTEISSSTVSPEPQLSQENKDLCDIDSVFQESTTPT